MHTFSPLASKPRHPECRPSKYAEERLKHIQLRLIVEYRDKIAARYKRIRASLSRPSISSSAASMPSEPDAILTLELKKISILDLILARKDISRADLDFIRKHQCPELQKAIDSKAKLKMERPEHVPEATSETRPVAVRPVTENPTTPPASLSTLPAIAGAGAAPGSPGLGAFSTGSTFKIGIGAFKLANAGAADLVAAAT